MTALAAGAVAVPASASLGQVCRIQAKFRIGGDDVRGNTTIQISAGGESFLAPGGIPGNTTEARVGALSRCIPHSALLNGFTITSISNPSWPETTDNWDMAGLSLIDPDTGREYLRRPANGTLMHRFTGQAPTFRTTSIVVRDSSPFFDHRYADCSGSMAFARFVDPLRPAGPTFTVTMRRPNTAAPIVSGTAFGAPFNDWGGRLDVLGITVASAAFVAFDARTPDGRTASGVISTGCDPDGI
ncbi:hypothetical protein [Kibdelosporangium aridum]|uniref:hypothetical protein n=1 Tax=Kibdelosporangium aridum TaxID=2030 RepID=UPI0035E6108A